VIAGDESIRHPLSYRLSLSCDPFGPATAVVTSSFSDRSFQLKLSPNDNPVAGWKATDRSVPTPLADTPFTVTAIRDVVGPLELIPGIKVLRFCWMSSHFM